MKIKYVYYIAIVFLVAFVINYIGIFGLSIWGFNNAYQNNQRNKKFEIPQEVYLSKQKYKNHYRPTIDSLLEADSNLVIDYIDKAIVLYPNEYYLEFQKGVAYYKIDSFDTALKHFNKSIKKNGYEYPGALGYAGWALAELGRYDEAIINLKKAADS